MRILRRSGFYRTAPWGVPDQPDFVNLCAAAATALSPQAFLALIHRIEADLGRERRERWGPRPIDIDVLTYGDATVDEPGLTIPHPRLTERAFVLVPLAEIAGDVAIAGKTVREWAERSIGSGDLPCRPRPRDPGTRADGELPAYRPRETISRSRWTAGRTGRRPVLRRVRKRGRRPFRAPRRRRMRISPSRSPPICG